MRHLTPPTPPNTPPHPLGQSDRHLADDVFIYIFVNETFCILIKISLNFVPNGQIDDNQALV